MLAPFLRGAVVGWIAVMVTATAYDTSANVQIFGGAKAHLTFAGILAVGAIGALIGGFVWLSADVALHKQRTPPPH